VARRHGMETSFELEDEELLLRESFGRYLEATLAEELGLKCSASFAVIDELGSACEREGVLVLICRERVHRVSAIAVEVAALG
jgi:hypothetical protein